MHTAGPAGGGRGIPGEERLAVVMRRGEPGGAHLLGPVRQEVLRVETEPGGGGVASVGRDDERAAPDGSRQAWRGLVGGGAAEQVAIRGPAGGRAAVTRDALRVDVGVRASTVLPREIRAAGAVAGDRRRRLVVGRRDDRGATHGKACR